MEIRESQQERVHLETHRASLEIQVKVSIALHADVAQFQIQSTVALCLSAQSLNSKDAVFNRLMRWRYQTYSMRLVILSKTFERNKMFSFKHFPLSEQEEWRDMLQEPGLYLVFT